MLGWMRKKTRSWFVYVAFGIIIIVFVFFYGWGRRGQREQVMVASVNGQKIFRRQYEESYQNLLALARSNYQRGLTQEEVEHLRRKALDDLVQRSLLLQEAERLGFSVTNEEVKEEIAGTPSFQAGGRFDREVYLRQLAANRITPGEYERAVREELLIDKLMGTLQASTKLSDKELFELYRWENDKVNLKFLRFNPIDFEKGVQVSAEEKATYYEEVKEQFKVPTKVKVRYLAFDPEDYKAKVEVTPAKVDDYYKTNRARFFHKKRVRARHILIAIKGKAEGDEESARRRAEEIRMRIEKGEDFSQLARKYSEDGATAAKGGDLGYFEQGQVLEGLDETAFSLKPGEISPIVKTTRGFHLIKVEDIQEEGTDPLERVRGEIEEEIRKEEGRVLAREEAQRALLRIYPRGDLSAFAAERGLKVYETNFFAEGEPVEGLGMNKDFTDAAFLLKEGEVSPLVQAGGRYFLLQLVERKEAYVPSLPEVEAEVEKGVKKKESNEVAARRATQLLQELASGVKLDELVRREKMVLEETGFFTRRSGYVNKIGPSEELLREAFSLTEKEPLPRKVYAVGSQHFIVMLAEKKEGDETIFQSQKEELRERFLGQKKGWRVTAWLEELRDNADIEEYLTFPE